MGLRQPVRRLSVDELLERAASVASLAMLREYAEPSPIQIAAIDEYAVLLDSELESLPPYESPTRDRILAQLDIHWSIFAPIRRLPTELLCEIFSCVQDIYPLRTLQAATVISHVCFTWRTVARGHGSLWTKVIVGTMNDFDKYCERFLPLARQAPLELRCDNREILMELWDRIASYASRWRRITLVAGLRMLPDLQVLYMENLERLVVDAYDAPTSTEISALDFVVAPRLGHLALTLDALQSERQLYFPVVQMLTSLDITTDSPFPITLTLPLLKACASTLRSLTLKVRYPLEGPEGSYPTSTSEVFAMEALTFLSLVDPACSLLNIITAPLVEVLILSNVPAYGAASLLHFLTRGHDARYLTEIRVYKPENRNIPAWLPCLQLMNSLAVLHFDDLLSNRAFLELLVRHKDTLLPSLKFVNICQIARDHKELHDILGGLCRARARKRFINGQVAYEELRWVQDYPI
ncbi:hypothetical protein EV714DRAFT_268228 [Schizophyllum commune]